MDKIYIYKDIYTYISAEIEAATNDFYKIVTVCKPDLFLGHTSIKTHASYESGLYCNLTFKANIDICGIDSWHFEKVYNPETETRTAYINSIKAFLYSVIAGIVED